MRPRFDAQRCARVRGILQNVSMGFGAMFLYNDSPGPYLLVVRDIQVFEGNGLGIAFGNYSGFQGTTIFSPLPMVSNAPQPPGKLYVEELATEPPTDWFTVPQVQASALLGPSNIWFHDYPFAVITPGFSLLAVIDAASNDQYELAYVYQFLTPEELYEIEI